MVYNSLIDHQKQIRVKMKHFLHTVNFGSEMVEALQVSRKNIFCSLNLYKIKEKRIFEIVHCPFELSPNQHWPAGPFGWLYWCSSAQPSKGQCTISEIFLDICFPIPFTSQNSLCVLIRIIVRIKLFKVALRYLSLFQNRILQLCEPFS